MHRRTQSVLWVASLVLVGSAALAGDAPHRTATPGRGGAKVVPAGSNTISTNTGDVPIHDQSNSEHRQRSLRSRSGTPAPRECDARSVLLSVGRWIGVEFESACFDQR